MGTNSRSIMANFYLHVNANNLVLFKKKNPKQHELWMTVIHTLQKRILQVTMFGKLFVIKKKKLKRFL